MGIPVETQLLVRVKNTRPQKKQDHRRCIRKRQLCTARKGPQRLTCQGTFTPSLFISTFNQAAWHRAKPPESNSVCLYARRARFRSRRKS